MWKRLQILTQTDRDNLPDAFAEIEQQIREIDAAAAKVQAALDTESETLKQHEQARADLELQRRYLEEQMTAADKRAQLQPHFDEARRRYHEVHKRLEALSSQIATLETNAAALKDAYGILLTHTRVTNTRSDYSDAINTMVANGMSQDEARTYREELTSFDRNTRLTREAIARRRTEYRDRELAAELAGIEQGLKGDGHMSLTKPVNAVKALFR